ncbi:MAG: hypothetical protein AAE975_01205 [Thermoplasmatales archaeon]
MRPQTRRKVTIISTVVAVIIVIALVSLYYWGPFSFYANGEKQLVLIVSEDSNSIISGQNITFRLGIFNNGPTSIFNVSDLWPTLGGEKVRLGISPCAVDIPYGFAVVPGNVSSSSIFTAKPLNMWQPGVYMCPVIYPVSSYKIMGLSSNGYIISSSNSPIPITLSNTATVSGYWVASNPFNSSYHFVYFPAGQYTVIVADEWGAIAFLHFTVHFTVNAR